LLKDIETSLPKFLTYQTFGCVFSPPTHPAPAHCPNLNKRSHCLCSCGASQTEEHPHLSRTLHSEFRVDLLQSVT